MIFQELVTFGDDACLPDAPGGVKLDFSKKFNFSVFYILYDESVSKVSHTQNLTFLSF
jgi:hypothetical protein